mgnify:CR=1 FL=1|jgi:hypothetical protein
MAGGTWPLPERALPARPCCVQSHRLALLLNVSPHGPQYSTALIVFLALRGPFAPATATMHNLPGPVRYLCLQRAGVRVAADGARAQDTAVHDTAVQDTE